MSLLLELLEENRRFDPEYQGGLLTNHLSMCLVALHHLGASDERLQAFARVYALRLGPLRDDGGLRAGLGARLKRIGREALLREHLPALVSGLGGAAFHGLLRLAYALDVDDDAEVAHGIAYFEECRMDLGPLPSREGDEREPRLLLDELHRLRIPRPAAPNIALRMRAAAADPRGRTIASRLVIDDGTLPRLAAASLALYASTDDFTALHAVTACYAARALVPFVDIPTLVGNLWSALVAAYLSAGSPALLDEAGLEAMRCSAAPAWPEIARRATETDDDHVSKIVWSCLEEDRTYGDSLYRAVAWRVAERGSA